MTRLLSQVMKLRQLKFKGTHIPNPILPIVVIYLIWGSGGLAQRFG